MVIRKSVSNRIFDAANIVLMLFMALIAFYPLYYVAVCSFSNPQELAGNSAFILKIKGFTTAAYKSVLSNPNILTGYRTTIIVVVAGTFLSVLMTAVGAFLLTRKNFAIKGFLAYMMIFTMYFSGGMIPTYLMVYKYLNLKDSLLALILPCLINTYNLIVMRSNFAGVPVSLEESAKVDGANDLIVLFRIILPVSLPIIAVMIMFYGVSYWNSWFSAMLYMRTRTKYPLQLTLREILILNSSTALNSMSNSDTYRLADTIKYASIIIATLPIR